MLHLDSDRLGVLSLQAPVLLKVCGDVGTAEIIGRPGSEGGWEGRGMRAVQ